MQSSMYVYFLYWVYDFSQFSCFTISQYQSIINSGNKKPSVVVVSKQRGRGQGISAEPTGNASVTNTVIESEPLPSYPKSDR